VLESPGREGRNGADGGRGGIGTNQRPTSEKGRWRVMGVLER
jgi:hypothetical protein